MADNELSIEELEAEVSRLRERIAALEESLLVAVEYLAEIGYPRENWPQFCAAHLEPHLSSEAIDRLKTRYRAALTGDAPKPIMVRCVDAKRRIDALRPFASMADFFGDCDGPKKLTLVGIIRYQADQARAALEGDAPKEDAEYWKARCLLERIAREVRDDDFADDYTIAYEVMDEDTADVAALEGDAPIVCGAHQVED